MASKLATSKVGSPALSCVADGTVVLAIWLFAELTIDGWIAGAAVAATETARKLTVANTRLLSMIESSMLKNPPGNDFRVGLNNTIKFEQAALDMHFGRSARRR